MTSILDRRFKYRPSAEHDASTEPFRRRQQARMRLAQRAAKREQAKVATLPRRAKA